MHCTSQSLLRGAFHTALRQPATTPPAFLLPFATQQSAAFSTTAILGKSRRVRRDANPARGTSALYRSGLKKQKLTSIRLENLPKPVLDPEQRSAPKVNRNHGLWGFFNDDREAIQVPTVVVEHGREWTVPELRMKDWDDLHRLWWRCVREINRIKTMEAERMRVEAGYGDYEADNRLGVVRKTMKAIKHTLTERWYTWENARRAAMEDPSIDLYADEAKGEKIYDSDKEPKTEPKKNPRQDAFDRAKSMARPTPTPDVLDAAKKPQQDAFDRAESTARPTPTPDVLPPTDAPRGSQARV